MPTPTVITDLDPVAANNFPAGSNAPSVLDDVQRAHAAFIRQTYNSINGPNTTITSLSILPGYLYGCAMSTAGSSATMSIAAGRATDSTGAQSMALTAISKTTSAWAVGTAQGGLDTGAIANSTWYHFYVIRRPDTGVVDVCFSTNATTPTLPTNYTQYRRIGSMKTNGSAQWVKFIQDGDLFTLDAPVTDYSQAGPTSGAITITLASVPLGVRVGANLNVSIINSSGNDYVTLSDLAITQVLPSISTPKAFTVLTYTSTAYGIGASQVMTNTAQGIRSVCNSGSGTTTLNVMTNGWTDSRGRNA